MPLTANAAVDQAEVIKKVATGTALTQEEKDWFTNFFGGTTLQSGERALSSTDKALTSAEYSWVVNAKKYLTKQDNVVIAGTDNFAFINNNATGAIFGYKNYSNTASFVVGNNNTSIGTYGIVTGYQNGVIGTSGIAIGNANLASTVGVSIGHWSVANDASIALGAYSLALGNSSLAFGYDASAGALDAINIYKNSDDGYGSGWTTNQAFSELQKDFPEIYGTYDENQNYDERDKAVKQKIFDIY